MTKRFIVTYIGEDRVTILAYEAGPEEVFPAIIKDAVASDVLAEHPGDIRETAIEMAARMQGLEHPPFPTETKVYGRTYRIEELADDGNQLQDNLVDVSRKSASGWKVMPHRIALPASRLRYEIWPNEPKHRGRPHCKVSRAEKSANFAIPDAELLVGDISPDEREAVRTIRKYGDELLKLWHRMRPDDQKL